MNECRLNEEYTCMDFKLANPNPYKSHLHMRVDVGDDAVAIVINCFALIAFESGENGGHSGHRITTSISHFHPLRRGRGLMLLLLRFHDSLLFLLLLFLLRRLFGGHGDGW